DLKALADRAVTEIAAAADEAALEASRVRYLGRKEGALSEATKKLASLPPPERPAYGAAVNDAKIRIEKALEAREAALRDAALARELGQEREDLSLPPRRVRLGRLHPISQTMREVSRIFATLGFETVEGPEIEWDYYNFEALNIPPGHPAREKWQTLWISNPLADDCFACEGKDPNCHVCGGDGWIEAAGCGMVHPDVLRRVGYDPTRYQGFAFGGGIERIAMLKTGAPDIRLFYQNDIRYLEQF